MTYILQANMELHKGAGQDSWLFSVPDIFRPLVLPAKRPRFSLLGPSLWGLFWVCMLFGVVCDVLVVRGDDGFHNRFGPPAARVMEICSSI